MHSEQITRTDFDFIFCGFGISAGLLLRALERKDLLAGKRIAIIEPRLTRTNDKTLCFWAEPDSDIVQDNSDIISSTWRKAAVPPFRNESLAPFRYHRIDSIHLYTACKSLAEKHGITIIESNVRHIAQSEQGLVVTHDQGFITAQRVYDSRPPQRSTTAKLLQSFLGQKIKLKEPQFDPDCLTLMDFWVPQNFHTQFVYTLPDSANVALVEFTRFGTEAISHPDARAALKAHVTDKYGEYTILEEEYGVIPMSTEPMTSEPLPGVVHIGTRGNAVKPSTGYAFETMFEHAKALCESFDNHQPPIQRKARFQFYDRLLVDMLERNPTQGKSIFLKLFKHQPVANVMRFLHERTSMVEEAKIFARLPWPPFLLAASRDIQRHFGQVQRSLILIAITLLYLLTVPVFPSIANGVMTAFLCLGLILVGIPHGAIDHRVLGETGLAPWNLKFLGTYLGLMAGMGMVWVVSPPIALTLFVLFSAWHFGETEFEAWQIPNKGLAFGWGLLLLGAIIGAHLNEVVPLLANMEIHLPTDIEAYGWGFALLAIGLGSTASVIYRSGAWLASNALIFAGLWTPLPISFGLYFVGQHSWTAWRELKQSLPTNDTPLWIHAVPFSIGAVVLFSVALLMLPFDQIEVQSLLVIFGACISFPHILCMTHFYKRRLMPAEVTKPEAKSLPEKVLPFTSQQ